MDLNLSTAVFMFAFSSSIILCTLILLIRHYLNYRYRHGAYISIITFIIFCWSLGQCLANLFESSWIFIISILVIIPWTFLLLLLLDLVSRESFDPIKLIFFTFVSTLMVLSIFDPAAILFFTSPLNEKGMVWGGNFELTGTLLMFFQGLLWIYYCIKIHLSAPKNLKRYSRLLIVGSIFISLFAPIVIVLGYDKIILGLDGFILAIGFAISMIAFSSEPKLAYILPFKALNLTVIDFKKGGLPLYSYNWNPRNDLIDDSLFSAMLTGVSGILQESIKKGNVREIHLENAVLIIKRAMEYPIAFVVLSTKSSHSLKKSIDIFSKLFIDRYNQYFDDLLLNQDNFQDAGELVLKSFPFVPEY